MLPRYYRLKVVLYKTLIGNEALSYVLYDSLFPQVVLMIGGATVGKRCRINRWLTIHESGGSFKNLVIGNDVHIGKHVFIDLASSVIIKNHAGIGMYSKILTHRNPGKTKMEEVYTKFSAPVVIGESTILCIGAVLLPGTKLGSRCIVLPNTVVKGNYADDVSLMGNPCRMTLRRQEHENQ